MEKYEFTKKEIATYLRDYNRLVTYATTNQNVPFFDVFKHHMANDGRLQYSIKDYYYEMISIYEVLLLSKFFTMLYDNYFEYLLDSSIDELSIPDSIFLNSSDKSKFSKKQIIKYIRNAFNHNDNDSHDLLKFIRVNEDGKDKIKVEILLKNVKPIPFHAILDINQLVTLCFEIKKSNAILIGSNRSTKPINLTSETVNETLDNMFLRKFYCRKKLSEEQKEQLLQQISNSKSTKNNEQFFLDNGMEYKDFKYSIAQKIKIEEDLKYWESIGENGNNVVGHLVSKVMPFSFEKDRVMTINLILSNYYIRDGNKSFFDLVRDARKILLDKKCAQDSSLYLYASSFGIDDNILYDAIDFENILSIPNSIYYGYIFDSLITDEDVVINDRNIKREKIRDSFVHMRWYKGINECFKLFDWDNGIDNEFNRNSEKFWSSNIRYVDLADCSEKYFKSCITSKDVKEEYMNLPIHIKKIFSDDKIIQIAGISYIKDGIFYNLDLTDENCNLLVCDDSQVQRQANDDETKSFLIELDNLTNKEKEDYRGLLDDVKSKLLILHINENKHK